MLVTSILSFSHHVLYPIKHRNCYLKTLNLLSANALNLYKSKILLIGEELNSPTKKAFENIVFEGENAGNLHSLL